MLYLSTRGSPAKSCNERENFQATNATTEISPQTITDKSPANTDNDLTPLEPTNVVPISNLESKKFAFPSLLGTKSRRLQ